MLNHMLQVKKQYHKNILYVIADKKMWIWVYLKNAFASLIASRLRSALSSLGIIIGILSVVVLLALGQWATASILWNIEALGTNLLMVSPGWSQQSNVRWSQWGRWSENVLTLTESDIISKLPNVAMVSPEYSSRGQFIYLSNNAQETVYWVMPSYLHVRNSTVAYGSFITQKNVDDVDKVAVIWSDTATVLFGSINPIGKDIRMGNTILTVIGVMKSKWTQWFGNADDVVFVPLSTAQERLFGTKYLSDISLSVATAETVDATKALIQSTLLTHFNIKSADAANFSIQNQADMVSTISSVTGTLKLFLWAIAGIALVVWGIWVMNIMLVSVAERTREIWIRKAVGAQNKDIILQFLCESLVLCVVGGIIGILLSYLIVFALKSVIAWIITLQSIIMAVWFSILIGLSFGIFPAYRAAKLKPIEALRYE